MQTLLPVGEALARRAGADGSWAEDQRIGMTDPLVLSTVDHRGVERLAQDSQAPISQRSQGHQSEADQHRMARFRNGD